MSSEHADLPLIEADSVSKAYRVWRTPAARLAHPLRSLLGVLGRPRREAGHESPDFREVHALRETSFQVHRGESLAIIGRNGSGKSTLLQILAGTLQPTTGRVVRRGRIAALLELGSGFNPEFTGRENVELNAAILGFTPEQTAAEFDRIASFADIGEFIEQPVKTYSSGMMVRLAFSVAVVLQPDVLIVDEALSVGDVFFQQKCFKRVRQILDSGASLIFVSHDASAVRNLCRTALVLDKGKPVFQGPPSDGLTLYHSLASGRAIAGETARGSGEAAPAFDESLRREIEANNLLPGARQRTGRGEVALAGAAFINQHGVHSAEVEVGATARWLVLLHAKTARSGVNVGLHLYDRMGNLVFAASLLSLGQELLSLEAGAWRCVEIDLTWDVAPGVYTYSLGCGQPAEDAPNHGVVQDRHEGLGPVTVSHPAGSELPFHGIARLPMKARVRC